MVTQDDPLVQKISADIAKEYEFIPILTIISIIISAIQLLWKCAKPKDANDGRMMLANSYKAGKYSKIAIIFTQREIMKTAKKQGVTLTLSQASDISHKILDALRSSDENWTPDFNLI
jgi:hypothetical protein